jgi:hypothetical protein
MVGRATVVESPAYLSKAERIMSEELRSQVVDDISVAPMSGVVIKGSGGLRKLRVALRGRGKRGGGRVIYWYHGDKYPAVLLWAFAKNEASDLTPTQLKLVRAQSERLIGEFGDER